MKIESSVNVLSWWDFIKLITNNFYEVNTCCYCNTAHDTMNYAKCAFDSLLVDDISFMVAALQTINFVIVSF